MELSLEDNIQKIKTSSGIIGNSAGLNHAISIAVQVAMTDLSVLVLGESGAGKEKIPQIIHRNSRRAGKTYIAVNCGAIPEGTIDSELFGHLKGAFTNAITERKGYFEEADGGTIFLDEVAELPMPTQARLLRVLESGEFMKVGSSKVEKTDVRIIAATNVNLQERINNGKFREDLYYRLNTVPIIIPPLRERKEDIHLLFRKFARDFADKYNMPAISLTNDATALLENYRWPGNVRELKHVVDQISIIEKGNIIDKKREISAEILKRYLEDIHSSSLPAIVSSRQTNDFSNEREILYKVLFDLKKEMDEMKILLNDIIDQNPSIRYSLNNNDNRIITDLSDTLKINTQVTPIHSEVNQYQHNTEPLNSEIVEEVLSLSLEDNKKELIIKALDRNKTIREAAKELGYSERSLYRAMVKYGIKKKKGK